jgi:phosphomannomutase
MNLVYIFDVDGTLTPSRQAITDEMREFFTQFTQNNEVCLVSGSDYVKTIEQLGQDIVEDCVNRSYNCSGNSVWERGMEMYSSSWRLPDECSVWLERALITSEYPDRTGKHIEHRPGAVNFSIVGRNADLEQRARYVEYDKVTNEREKLAEDFNIQFEVDLNTVATIGGETGIDITEKGKDKQQVLDDFSDRTVYFFGDRCEAGGNDYPLAHAITERRRDGDKVFNVSGWQDTLDILRRLTNNR